MLCIFVGLELGSYDDSVVLVAVSATAAATSDPMAVDSSGSAGEAADRKNVRFCGGSSWRSSGHVLCAMV